MDVKTATFTMSGDDPQTVKRILFHLYTLDYADHELPDSIFPSHFSPDE